MDELEDRVCAHELALIEVVAHVGASETRAAIGRIREDLPFSLDGDERVIRRQAIQLLEDALHRFDPPASGLHLRVA